MDVIDTGYRGIYVYVSPNHVAPFRQQSRAPLKLSQFLVVGGPTRVLVMGGMSQEKDQHHV